MTTRRKIFISAIILCLLVVVYMIYTYCSQQETLEQGALEDFGKSTSWEHDVLVDGKQIISANDLIYYTNMSKKISVPLCTNPDCLHNTEDCTAQFGADVKFLYFYKNKIYAGCNTGDGVVFYQMNTDGSNRDEITHYTFGDEIFHIDFMESDSKIYVVVGVADTSKVTISDDGVCSDAPVHMQILCMDLISNKIQKIYEWDKEYYQYLVNFRYVEGTKLFYEYSKQDLPEEEMRNGETGELLKPEYKEKEMEGVESLDLSTGEIHVEGNYQYGDYIGTDLENRYFVEKKDDHCLSGDIRCERNGKLEEIIHMKELENKKDYNCMVHLLKDGFALNEYVDEDGKGKISIFDISGKQKATIDQVDYYVIGEQEDFYLLGDNVLTDTMTAYVSKDDFGNLSKKCIPLWGEDK